MCLNPIKIPNPLYHSNPNLTKSNKYRDKYRNFEEPYVYRNCGHCAECLTARLDSWTQRCHVLGEYSTMYFAMLSIMPDMLSTVRIPFPEGELVQAFARRQDLSDCLKRLRRHHPDWKFKYLAVSEYGGQFHRPHFHVLFFFEKMTFYEANNFLPVFRAALFAEWARCTGPTSNPVYHPICKDIRKYRNGRLNESFSVQLVTDIHSYCERVGISYNPDRDGIESVSTYICKYILEPDEWCTRHLLNRILANREFINESFSLNDSCFVTPFWNISTLSSYQDFINPCNSRRVKAWKRNAYIQYVDECSFAGVEPISFSDFAPPKPLEPRFRDSASFLYHLVKPLFFASDFLGLDCIQEDEPAVTHDVIEWVDYVTPKRGIKRSKPVRKTVVDKPAVKHVGKCRECELAPMCTSFSDIRKMIDWSVSLNNDKPASMYIKSDGHSQGLSSYFRERFEDTPDLDVYASRDPLYGLYHPGSESVLESRRQRAVKRLSKRKHAYSIDRVNENDLF